MLNSGEIPNWRRLGWKGTQGEERGEGYKCWGAVVAAKGDCGDGCDRCVHVTGPMARKGAQKRSEEQIAYN